MEPTLSAKCHRQATSRALSVTGGVVPASDREKRRSSLRPPFHPPSPGGPAPPPPILPPPHACATAAATAGHLDHPASVITPSTVCERLCDTCGVQSVPNIILAVF